MTDNIEKAKDYFTEKMTEVIDELFPKGESKERGKALVLNAKATILMMELLEQQESKQYKDMKIKV